MATTVVSKVARFTFTTKEQLANLMDYCTTNNRTFTANIEIPVLTDEEANELYKVLVLPEVIKNSDRLEELLTEKESLETNLKSGVMALSTRTFEEVNEEIKKIEDTDYTQFSKLMTLIPDTILPDTPAWKNNDASVMMMRTMAVSEEETSNTNETTNEELTAPIVKGQNTVWAEEELEKYKAAFKKLDPNFELQIVRHDDTGEICFHLWWPKREMIQECTSTKLLDMAFENAKAGWDDPVKVTEAMKQ
jgi:hypothetical protein